MAITEESVTASMDKLVAAINQLTDLVKTAAEEMHAEEPNNVEQKLDMLIQQNADLIKQNEEISSSLLLLLELNRQHLPTIAAQVKKPVIVPRPVVQPSDRQQDSFGMPDLGMPPELPRI
jgi:hypothetical protein